MSVLLGAHSDKCARGFFPNSLARITALVFALLFVPLTGSLSGCGGSGSTNGGGGSGGSGGGGGTTPTAATPTFSPAAGAYTSAQSVTVSDPTSGATIYYTTDGSTPTASSTKYSGAITVSATETINAIATASGYNNSAVASATYTINLSAAAATPVFSPPAGTYTGDQTIAISDATPGALIYYTLDGSTPTTNSFLYNGSFTIGQSTTVKAIAAASGYSNSAVATAAYTINTPTAATPTFSVAAGTYTSAFYLTLSDTTPNAAIYYTSDGSTPTTSSSRYTVPFAITQSEAVKAIAVASGYSNSSIASAVYTVSPDIESSIVTFLINTNESGRMVLNISQLGIVQGAAAGTPVTGLGSGSTVQILNPDSSDSAWDYAASFLGGKRLQTSSDSFTDPFYVVNQPASGSAKVYSFTRTTVTDASTDTVQTTVLLLNSVSLPFNNNTDGSRAKISLVNTGAGIVAIANNSPAAYFAPTNTDGSLGTFSLLNALTPTGENVTGLWIDENDNVGVITGGTSSTLNMYDQSGHALLSGPAGLVSPNSMIGTTPDVIPAGTNVSVTIAPSLSQTISLFYAQASGTTGTNIGSFLVQPGSNGGAPAATTAPVNNPNGSGVPFGATITFIAGPQSAAAGIPQGVYVVDQAAATLWSFTVSTTAAGNANALSFTQTGLASLPFSSGIDIAQSSATFALASSASTQPGGFYLVPKDVGNTLGSLQMSGPPGSAGDTFSILTDLSGNFMQSLPGGANGYNSAGQYMSTTAGASNVSVTMLNSSYGSIIDFGTGGSSPVAQIRASSRAMTRSRPNANPGNAADNGNQQ